MPDIPASMHPSHQPITEELLLKSLVRLLLIRCRSHSCCGDDFVLSAVPACLHLPFEPAPSYPGGHRGQIFSLTCRFSLTHGCLKPQVLLYSISDTDCFSCILPEASSCTESMPCIFTLQEPMPLSGFSRISLLEASISI